MSLSSAISNAVSGLTAVSRGTEIVASNLANASTPGYGAREVSLSARTFGGGVHVDGVIRRVPVAILADSRLAQADLGKALLTHDFHSRIEQAVGSANQPDSLLGMFNDFENALTIAAATPESGPRLQGVLDGAQALTQKIRAIADTIQASRSEADQRIAKDIDRLNTSLSEIARLNRMITVARSKGQDSAGLEDARQNMIAGISDIVAIQEVPRANGQIALFTKGGATLLDGTTPAKIEFSATPVITPQMSFQDGQLGGITFDGMALSGNQMSLFRGGSLEAAFDIRDNLAPGYQSTIDTYAADLYRRTATDTVDPTIGTGMPGLFTDRQSTLSNVDLPGFANRIEVNAALDPENGGILSRIRDGLYGPSSQNVADGTILNNIRDALARRDSAMIPRTGVASHSATTFASEILTFAANDRLKSEAGAQKSKSYSEGIEMMLAAHGVDSDQEIEQLIQLEKSYAANAKVIQAANDMLDQLLRLS